MGDVAAIVLAAGRATRFGANDGDSKVFALLEGRPLVAHVARAAIHSRATPVIVVTGQGAARAAPALVDLPVTRVHNPSFADGMAGSIVTGLAAVPDHAAAVLILLADMPCIAPATIDALIAAFERDCPDAVVPVYAGRRGNPVLLSHALFPALRGLRGDEGARRILRDPTLLVLQCSVDDPGVLIDVDTPDALDAMSRTLTLRT